MQRIIAVLVVALPLTFGNAVCGDHPDDKGKLIHVSVKPRDGGWLGVAIQDVTKNLVDKKGLKVKQGAYVNDVVDESPADSAGIRKGDVVVEFDGKSIATADDLMKAVRKKKPAAEATVGIMREDQKKSIRVILGTPPHRREVRVVVPPVPPVPSFRFHQGSSLYGMSIMELSDQLGEYFEAPGGKGVLVDRVKRGSDAETAGFKAGDVIIQIGKKQITDVDDIWQAMDDCKDGEKVNVDVVRKGIRKTLTLEADESELGSRMRFRFNHMPHILKQKDFKELEDWEEELGPEAEEMRLEMEDMQRDMEHLKQELQRIPEEIQENMKELQEQLKKVKEDKRA